MGRVGQKVAGELLQCLDKVLTLGHYIQQLDRLLFQLEIVEQMGSFWI